jgi:hypothetical protein
MSEITAGRPASGLARSCAPGAPSIAPTRTADTAPSNLNEANSAVLIRTADECAERACARPTVAARRATRAQRAPQPLPRDKRHDTLEALDYCRTVIPHAECMTPPMTATLQRCCILLQYIGTPYKGQSPRASVRSRLRCEQYAHQPDGARLAAHHSA